MPTLIEMRKFNQLPQRYSDPWYDKFYGIVQGYLFPGARVLDVGCGGTPMIPKKDRPSEITYVGLDLSIEELNKAPSGSYDEVVQADVVTQLQSMEDQFDLILSWMVLEHVKPLRNALENIRSYLRPGGVLVTQLSGSFSGFGLINKLVPQKFGIWAMRVLLARAPETVFPAYYDHCYYSALIRIMSPWSECTVTPLYRGAGYFDFSPRLQRLYLTYEDWVIRAKYLNLATHYLVVARK